MIRKLFKGLIPVFLSVVFGGVCGMLVFSNYDVEVKKNLKGEKLYLIQMGEYRDYDNMISNTLVNNFVYYKDDDGMFKSVVGITNDSNNLEKIKSIYEGELVVNEYYSNDKKLNKQIKEYDKMLYEIDNSDDIKKIVFKMLELYKGNNSTLIKIIS